MAKYRVTEPSFVGGKLCEAGEIVDYDGPEVAQNLEPVKRRAATAEPQAETAEGETPLA